MRASGSERRTVSKAERGVLHASPSRASSEPVVLVVDDDDAVRSTLQKLLRREGYQVLTSCDGSSALQAFRRHRPDLVLLDVIIPELGGFEVCRILKENPETCLTPVVLLTGLGDVSDRVLGIEAGADDFLSKPFEPVELLARARSLVRLKGYTDELEHAESVLFALARSIEARDPYTEGHCERLSRYGSDLGKRLGMPLEDLTALRRAGVLHDIGKVTVPDAILLKDGPLNPEEQGVMREHPVTGERICASLRSFSPVLPIIRYHHEKLDGSGYPDELRGDQIPLTARLLQIVDVYDALTTSRPYRRALPPSEAFDIMDSEVRRGWWDPEVFAEFSSMVRQQSADDASCAVCAGLEDG